MYILSHIYVVIEFNLQYVLPHVFYVIAPPRMFEIAFKMFDLNGDGDVVFEEYEKVHISELTYISHLLVDHWLNVLRQYSPIFFKKCLAVCATFADVYDSLQISQ